MPDVSVAHSFLYAFDDGDWKIFDSATAGALYEARILQDYPLP